MSKLVTGSRPCEVAAQSALATIQIPLPLASVLMDAKQGLLDLVVSTGLQVFEAMLPCPTYHARSRCPTTRPTTSERRASG